MPTAFVSEDYRTRKQAIEAQFKRVHEQAFQTIQKEVESEGVGLIRTPVGLALAPIREGQVIVPEQFQQLPEAEPLVAGSLSGTPSRSAAPAPAPSRDGL